jgi:hypothetical protein
MANRGTDPLAFILCVSVADFKSETLEAAIHFGKTYWPDVQYIPILTET